jgi:hypothetical protein
VTVLDAQAEESLPTIRRAPGAIGDGSSPFHERNSLPNPAVVGQPELGLPFEAIRVAGTTDDDPYGICATPMS